MTAGRKEAVGDGEPLTPLYLDELRLRLTWHLRDSTISFSKLVRSMEGAYPTDVLNALTSLQREGRISESFLESLLPPDASVAIVSLDDDTVDLGLGPKFMRPEPHPLDYDWRFTASSLLLLDEALSRLGADRVATLGAPTLYLHLWKSGRQPSLYDKNDCLIEQFRNLGLERLVCCDLLEHPPFRSEADVVIADPPWYLEHYAAFINAAQQLLTDGGFLLLSVLPRLTRPSASSDRVKILDLAHANGFDVVEAIPAILSYTSPPFEVSALRAEGLWHGSWRSGDLFVLKKTLRTPEQSLQVRGITSEEWESFTVGRTTVRVKHSSGRQGCLRFEPASLTGDVYLHSVSRRSPTRSRIDLWTSRNLALTITRPEYLSEVLLLKKAGLGFAEAIDHVASTNTLGAAGKEVLCDIVRLLMKDAGLDLHEHVA